MRLVSAVALPLIFAAIAPSFAQALSIGVTPFSADMGIVESGKNYVVEFFVLSDSNEEVVLDVKYRPADSDFLNKRPAKRYVFVPEEASEQDMATWVEFIEEVVTVPSYRQDFFSGSQKVNANKKISFIVRIPRDAEPGYHAGYVSLDPRSRRQAIGTNVGIITVVDFLFVFRVPGEATRSGYIVGIVHEPERRDVDVLLKNNGTVTLRVQNSGLRLARKGQPDIYTQANGASIPPGNLVSIPMPFDPQAVPGGEYTVEAFSSWVTGSSSYARQVFITSVPPATGQAFLPEALRPQDNTLLLLVIAVTLLIVYYWRNRK